MYQRLYMKLSRHDSLWKLSELNQPWDDSRKEWANVKRNLLTNAALMRLLFNLQIASYIC
jgi:hypothetical protein